ncbi:unnamed protein product [Closterium sp. NIES-65]|nr:unnamed protein product [Closterium sp. NIES-65]
MASPHTPGGGLSAGAIAGIVAAVVCDLLLASVLLYRRSCGKEAGGEAGMFVVATATAGKKGGVAVEVFHPCPHCSFVPPVPALLGCSTVSALLGCSIRARTGQVFHPCPH